MYRSEAVRKLLDCLIGAVAVRAGVEILHSDSDFVALARPTELRPPRFVGKRRCLRWCHR
jgi:predicted nucleic acid-binding protein